MNVDLEIESNSKLDSFAAELDDHVMVLHSGPAVKGGHLLCLESSREHQNADATIRTLCLALGRVSARARRLWDTARRKEFDVGYELRTGERSSHFTLRADTLRRITSLGATLAVTYYREDDP